MLSPVGRVASYMISGSPGPPSAVPALIPSLQPEQVIESEAAVTPHRRTTQHQQMVNTLI